MAMSEWKRTKQGGFERTLRVLFKNDVRSIELREIVFGPKVVFSIHETVTREFSYERRIDVPAVVLDELIEVATELRTRLDADGGLTRARARHLSNCTLTADGAAKEHSE